MGKKRKFVYPPIEEIMEIFFRAMLAGYAGTAKKETPPDSPGMKRITFKRGRYLVIDQWQTSPESDFSFGGTTIFYNDVPIWWMTYEGWYLKETIPFLKEALAKAYSARSFLGGRGQDSFQRGQFLYRNLFQGSFVSFCGREFITKADQELGHHEYRGGLIPQRKKRS